jgi:hypothetical protein
MAKQANPRGSRARRRKAAEVSRRQDESITHIDENATEGAASDQSESDRRDTEAGSPAEQGGRG